MQISELARFFPKDPRTGEYQHTGRAIFPLIKSQIDNLGLRKPQSLLELDKTAFFLAYKGYEHLLDRKPPQYILHQLQVRTVAVNLAGHDPDTQIHPLTHDMGRAWDMNSKHRILGLYALIALGYDPKSPYPQFALDHDMWGFGGRIGKQFLPEVDRFINKKTAAKGNEFFNEVLNGEYSKQLEPIFEGMYQLYLQNYGISGPAVLIADNSKRKIAKNDSDEYKRYLTEIVAFTPELAQELIDDQIKNGNYKENSPRHRIEILGSQFLIYAINKFQEDTGINYASQIQNARLDWDSSIYHESMSLWNEVIDETEKARPRFSTSIQTAIQAAY